MSVGAIFEGFMFVEGTVGVLSKEECIEGTEVPFLKDLCSWEVLWGFY